MQLVPLTSDDAQRLAELFFSIGMTKEQDTRAALSFIQHLNSQKATGRKLVVNGLFVGGGQLTVQKFPHCAELGFWVHKDCQGLGYGSAIASLFLELGFTELGFHRIFAKTFSNNLRSLRVLERAGMIREGVLRDAGEKEGRYYDEIYFGQLRHEWEKRPRPMKSDTQ